MDRPQLLGVKDVTKEGAVLLFDAPIRLNGASAARDWYFGWRRVRDLILDGLDVYRLRSENFNLQRELEITKGDADV